MNIDENQVSQHQYLQQKKYSRQNDVVLGFGSRLLRAGCVKKAIKDLLQTLVKDMDYLHAKVTIFGGGASGDVTIEHGSDMSLVSQVEAVIERVEKEAQRTLIFKMHPIQNKLEVKQPLLPKKSINSCVSFCVPLVSNVTHPGTSGLLFLYSFIIATAAL